MAAGQRFEMGLALAVMTVLLAGAGVTAQQSSSGCSNVLISLSPCLNYITGNSSTPSSGCCSQLGSVVRSQPQCLCEVLNGGGSSLGIEVNQTQAVALPGACNVQTPPVSRGAQLLLLQLALLQKHQNQTPILLQEQGRKPYHPQMPALLQR